MMAKYILTKRRDRAALMADPSLDAFRWVWLGDRLKEEEADEKEKQQKGFRGKNRGDRGKPEGLIYSTGPISRGKFNFWF